MGIQKQNINALLETNNIRKIEEIADKLDEKFSDLIDDGEISSLILQALLR